MYIYDRYKAIQELKREPTLEKWQSLVKSINRASTFYINARMEMIFYKIIEQRGFMGNNLNEFYCNCMAEYLELLQQNKE